MSVQASSIGANIDRLSKEDEQEGEEFARPMFSIEQLRAFKPILSFLNAKDRDILYLVFVSGKKQKDVQDILGRSQPSLSYDIKKIRRRLKFIFYLSSVFDIFINFVSTPNNIFEPLEIEVLVMMFYTSSFTMVAEVLSKPGDQISQGKVKHRFDKCLRKMEENGLWEMYEIFMIIRANLNLIRRVYRTGPADRRTCDVFIPQ